VIRNHGKNFEATFEWGMTLKSGVSLRLINHLGGRHRFQSAEMRRLSLADWIFWRIWVNQSQVRRKVARLTIPEPIYTYTYIWYVYTLTIWVIRGRISPRYNPWKCVWHHLEGLQLVTTPFFDATLHTQVWKPTNFAKIQTWVLTSNKSSETGGQLLIP
jgi:hypothetical protein